MSKRPPFLSALLILGTIAAGLVVRMIHLGLPFALVKYGGSFLWALMIYWIVSALRSQSPVWRNAILSLAVAYAVELFKLYRTPWLDEFRLTLPGALLLGRIFAVLDLIVYACAILVGALADRAIRDRR